LDGRIQLTSGLLGLDRVKLTAPWGRADLKGDLRLWGSGWRDMSKSMPFSIDRLDAKDVAIHKLVRGSGVTTEVSLALRKLTGKVSDPIRSLKGSGKLRTSSLVGGGEKVRQGRRPCAATQERSLSMMSSSRSTKVR